MSADVGAQVFGAAAQDPRVQAAAKDAAKETAMRPEVQQAAWKAAQDAARTGADFLKKEALEVTAYIQDNRFSVKALCFCNALALLVSSVLGLINVFGALFKPFQYLFAVYNMVFAAVIVVMDGNPEWFKKCFDARRKLFAGFPVLASQVGRACFYFYVGSINLLMLPDSFLWKVIYIAIGSSLCFAGILMLVDRCHARREEQAQRGLDPQV